MKKSPMRITDATKNKRNRIEGQQKIKLMEIYIAKVLTDKYRKVFVDIT
jgi:hypothetical protein